MALALSSFPPPHLAFSRPSVRDRQGQAGKDQQPGQPNHPRTSAADDSRGIRWLRDLASTRVLPRRHQDQDADRGAGGVQQHGGLRSENVEVGI